MTVKVAKVATTCSLCGETLQAGDGYVYDKEKEQVACLKCTETQEWLEEVLRDYLEC